jgi:hypothetical protein
MATPLNIYLCTCKVAKFLLLSLTGILKAGQRFDCGIYFETLSANYVTPPSDYVTMQILNGQKPHQAMAEMRIFQNMDFI